MISVILISYGCFHTKSNKPVMKNHRIAPNDKSRKEHKNLIRGWCKYIYSIVFKKVDGYLTLLKINC